MSKSANSVSSSSSKASTSTMKSILVSDFVSDDSKNFQEISMGRTAKPRVTKKNEMLIRVLACSLSPGDMIMVRGSIIFLKPSKLPFVPGMDVCGVVEEVFPGEESFKKGDVIVASNGSSCTGGLAEFMLVDSREAILKPPSVSVLEAAASSSAITARDAVMDYVKPGDRVLVLGGSGGVGSAAIAIAKKHSGASFIATTSTQEDFCRKLGADQVVNYKEQNWWEMEEFQSNKFDVIIDTVGGGNYTGKAHKVLKKFKRKGGGIFIAVTGDQPVPDAGTTWKAIKFFTRMIWHSFRSGYVLLLPKDVANGRKQVLDYMENGTLKIQLDPSSPSPFTQDAVRKAFQLVGSRHAHGKVVVSMESDD